MWNELKEHVKKQQERVKNKTAIGYIIVHVWKDVQNKMWSLEKNQEKEKMSDRIYICNECHRKHYTNNEPNRCDCGADNFGIHEK